MSGPQATRGVRAIWDREAPRYDRFIRVFDRYMAPGGREWVCSQAAGRVLEVAVGTGLNLPYYPAGTTLTALDVSPAMLDLARARARREQIPVAFVEGSAEALPFPDESFDTVVCSLSLCGIPDDRAAVREMHRVLRTGGRLVLLDHIVASNLAVRIAQRLLDKPMVRFCGDHQTRRPLHLVRDAGFTVQHRERSRAGIIERLTAVK